MAINWAIAAFNDGIPTTQRIKTKKYWWDE
jgi:hypothetical protein